MKSSASCQCCRHQYHAPTTVSPIDLLCCEECDDETFSGNELPEYSSESEYSRFLQGEEDVEEWNIGELIEHESDYGPGIDYVTRFESKCLDPSARSESIAWILKVQRYYGFQSLTACLCVNYLDRFLYSRPLPETSGWPLQLLSVACLSLAVKMEERMVPSLIDLQVEGAKYIFEPRTIKRMEILVLSILDWRLRSITPFNFINFFAYKVDPCSSYRGFLISRSSQIILSNLQETRFLQFRPSCIAAATIICAANDLPIFSCVTPQYTESWCYGLHKDQVTSCLQFIQKFMENDVPRKKIIPKWLPQLQVMSRLNMMSNESSSSSSSSLSSSSSSKRRRLDKSFWTDDEKGTSK